MEWIFTPRRSRVNCPSFIVGGLRKGQRDCNTVTSYSRSFFSKLNFLAFYILMTKCSALLIPITSTEIESNQLCPNPIDWQEPFTSLYPYRFFPNNVAVMDLVRVGGGEGEGSNVSVPSPSLPCRFRIGGRGTGVKRGHALLLSLQQRPRPLSFMQQCSKVLEFPGRGGDPVDEESRSTSSLTCVTAEEPSRPRDPVDQLNVNIRTLGQVKWGSGWKLVFDLPFQSASAPFIIALFRTTTQSGCELQIQQYYWSKGNDSWACAKDLKRKLYNNVCGRISCSKQDSLLQQLKGYLVPSSEVMLVDAEEEELGLPPKIRTLSYFLKGLLLPLIISLSATMAYIIWRKRMKAYAAAAELDGAVSLGTQTNQPGGGREEEGVLIQFEEDLDMERVAKDKPPTYESLLEPPSYDQAMSPLPPLSPGGVSHRQFMELNDLDLDLERHLLLKTPPPEEDDGMEDKTVALTPSPSTSQFQGPSGSGGHVFDDDDKDELDLSQLPPPPPFQ